LNGQIVLSAGQHIDYDVTATDTNGITFYAGDGTSVRNQTFILDMEHSVGAYIRMRITRAGSGLLAYVQDTTGWKAGCSRTIKHDIQELSDTDISELTGILEKTPLFKYKRNDVPSEQEVGLISEETPEIMGSDGYGISPVKSIGFLMAVIKGQEQKIKDLETRLSQLENK
jgi:hypothetical protein